MSRSFPSTCRNGQQLLGMCPSGDHQHLAHELASKGVYYARDRGSGSLADEIEIEHALDGSWLQATAQSWLAVPYWTGGLGVLTRQSIEFCCGRACGMREG